MAGRGQQTLRIIGGQWRGRKFKFPEAEHLRPTPDRVRETLFNWLIPVIDGASCLDLFSGSGALGLEALSRGAGHVSFVDTSKQVIQYLKQTCETLQTDRAEFFNGSAGAFLSRPARQFDVVFLDPPYDLNLIPETARQLQEGEWLKPGVLIYIEHDGRLDTNQLPSNWNAHREKIAGQVHYSLYRCQESLASP
jgi:16S rRNA (guanine966-N2)-methyltransferase